MSMNAGEFVGLLFLARDLAHKAHLKAKGEGSYAKHVALGEFYESLTELADEFAEQYQGRFDELLDVPLLDNEYEGEIRDVLNQIKAWIQDNRREVTDDTSLQNTLDEVVKLFQHTNFKLLFLE